MEQSILTLFLLLLMFSNAVELTNQEFSGITVGSPFLVTFENPIGVVFVVARNGSATDPQAVSTLFGVYSVLLSKSWETYEETC
jgi:hypothetical protein